MNADQLLASSPNNHMLQPQRLAFWIFCILLIGGIFTIFNMAKDGWQVMPTSVIVGLAAWIIYTLPLLWIFKRIGIFQSNALMPFFMAFVWGGLGAVYLALPANQAVFGILAKIAGPEFVQTWGPAIAGPSDEEPLKLIGVILLVLIAPGRFRTISSIMALGAVVGLGFQVVENYSYTINSAINHPNTDQLEPVFEMLLVRGLFCGPWSHAAYTAIATFGVGYFVTKRNMPLTKRLIVALAFFLLAWSFHALWNSPFIASMLEGNFVLLALPIKGVPILLATLFLWRVARRDGVQTA